MLLLTNKLGHGLVIVVVVVVVLVVVSVDR